MRLLSELPPGPELLLSLIGEPLSGLPRDARPGTHANAGATLHALGGPAAVLQAAADKDGGWDPSADEETGGFDIHLGVYASD